MSGHEYTQISFKTPEAKVRYLEATVEVCARAAAEAWRADDEKAGWRAMEDLCEAVADLDESRRVLRDAG